MNCIMNIIDNYPLVDSGIKYVLKANNLKFVVILENHEVILINL